MDPLGGWTVGVTAERRADDQAGMLTALGARVLLAPVLRSERQDDGALQAVTRDLVSSPPDVVVAATAVGVRAWIASSWSWGLGDRLLQVLASTEVVARGTKATGALMSEAIHVSWRAPGETLAEVRDHLLRREVRGRRVAVQGHGGDMQWFVDALIDAGADVVVVPVYRWARPESTQPAERLAQSVGDGEVDALTFTSPPAVTNFLELAGPGVRQALRAHDVVCACVGPVTGAAASAAEFPNVLVASPTRLGPMVRLLAERLGQRALELELAGVPLRVQGGHVTVGSRLVRLTPRERTLLHTLLAARGSVLSKQALATAAWLGDVEEHTVEVAVNRLRRKLGPAASALETSNRRGYRLAMGPAGAATGARSHLA